MNKDPNLKDAYIDPNFIEYMLLRPPSSDPLNTKESSKTIADIKLDKPAQNIDLGVHSRRVDRLLILFRNYFRNDKKIKENMTAIQTEKIWSN